MVAACWNTALSLEREYPHIYSMDHNRQRISVHDLTTLRIDVNGERKKPVTARSRKQASSDKLDARGNVVAARPFVKPHKHKLELGDEGLELLETLDHEYTGNKKRQKRNNYHPDLLPFLHPPTGAAQLGVTKQAADTLPSSVGAGIENISKNLHKWFVGSIKSHPSFFQLLL